MFVDYFFLFTPLLSDCSTKYSQYKMVAIMCDIQNGKKQNKRTNPQDCHYSASLDEKWVAKPNHSNTIFQRKQLYKRQRRQDKGLIPALVCHNANMEDSSQEPNSSNILVFNN